MTTYKVDTRLIAYLFGLSDDDLASELARINKVRNGLVWYWSQEIDVECKNVLDQVLYDAGYKLVYYYQESARREAARREAARLEAARRQGRRLEAARRQGRRRVTICPPPSNHLSAAE